MRRVRCYNLRGINGLPILDRTYRSSAPNMHHNEVRIFGWFA
jgi:hypothetical protein